VHGDRIVLYLPERGERNEKKGMNFVVVNLAIQQNCLNDGILIFLFTSCLEADSKKYTVTIFRGT